MDPEKLLEGPEDPISEILNQASVDLANHVAKGGELKPTKKPEPEPSADEVKARALPARAVPVVDGGIFPKLGRLLVALGLGIQEGVPDIVVSVVDMVVKVLSAAERLELRALEEKLKIEVELQGLIAKQVRLVSSVIRAPQNRPKEYRGGGVISCICRDSSPSRCGPFL